LQALYSEGIAAYEDEDWEHAVQFIEEALQQYYRDLGQCVAKCYAPFDSTSFTEFHRKSLGTASILGRTKLVIGE
jgi:hypothetical protein